MDFNSEVESFSQNDSVSSATSVAKYREDTVSAEEQSLLQILQKGISETTEENLAFAKEISSLLSKLHIETHSLPNDIREGLQKMSLILRAEKLSDADESILSIAMHRRKIEEKKRQREEKKLALLQDDLFRRHTTFVKKLEHLQSAVASLESTVEAARNENSQCNPVLLTTKLREYQQTVEKLEADLADLQVEEYYPQKILNKYQKYLETSGELMELNNYLNQYEDLPPNLLQAKALLEVRRKEYESLEREFFEKTNGP